MFFGPLLLIGLVVLAVWYYQQQQENRRVERSNRGPGSSDALEMLRMRYARGEISRDEFETIRRDLETT